MKHTAFAIAAIFALISPASAGTAQSLIDQCYARTYDAAHLAAHPGQAVTGMQVYFVEFEDAVVARISFATRDSDGRFSYAGDCYREIPGGLSCEGCVGDACESNGETFKVFPRGKDRIQIVNDTTGLSAETVDSVKFRLDAGGEHKDFVLDKVEPAVCGE